MPLSVTELTRIRLMTGADDKAVISDAQIQAEYTLALTDAPESALVLPYAYVYVLRLLLGYQRTKGNRTTEFGDNQTRSDITTNTEKLLARWEGQAGLEGTGRLTAGVLSLRLDEVDEETA